MNNEHKTRSVNVDVADALNAQAGQFIESGADVTETVEATFFAAVWLARNYMTPEDVAKYMRTLADEIEWSAANMQKGH